MANDSNALTRVKESLGMIFLKYFVLSLHVLMVFITALAPVLFYKRKGKCLMKFYLSMAGTAKARKIYRLQLEAWVFLVNLTYYLLNGPNTWQIPAMALSLILMTNTCTSAILRWLHDDKRVQLIACAVFFASLSLPQLYTLSVSVGMLIIWAMFYPSWVITQYYMTDPGKLKDFPPTKENIVFMYYHSQRGPCDMTFLDP